MLYMYIFHRLDFFHHDSMGFSCPTFVILLYSFPAPSNCEVGFWGQHRTKTGKSLPQQKECFLEAWWSLPAKRDFGRWILCCDGDSAPWRKWMLTVGKLRTADGKMHHLKVYLFWNRNKKPIDIWENDAAAKDNEKKHGKPTWKKHLQSIRSFSKKSGKSIDISSKSPFPAASTNSACKNFPIRHDFLSHTRILMEKKMERILCRLRSCLYNTVMNYQHSLPWRDDHWILSINRMVSQQSKLWIVYR